MRWINKPLALFATLILSAGAAWAQAKECTEDFKTATYSKWYDNRIEHQDVAFQAAEEYLAICPNDDSPYATAIKKFHAAYKAATSSITNKNQMEEANNKKNYPEVVRLGKQVLASEPDYVRAHMLIAIAGYTANASGNASLMPDAAQSAKKAIEMIEGGKSFEPYTSKEQALGSLNYIVGKATLKTAAADAIPLFLKAAKLNADLRKDPLLYLDLAAAYELGPRAILTDQYKAKQGPNGTETPESKLVLENLNQVIDRQIDAWARAAAVTTNPADKKAIMDNLTELYKYRNKSETGLTDLVAGILSKPLPEAPTPITAMPTPPPSTTPVNTGLAPTGGMPSNASGAASTPKATVTTNPAGAGSTTAKPTASPTPKPKPRRSNHRRH
jgi:hypothetical protein